jgi:flagellar hook-associated protein 2
MPDIDIPGIPNNIDVNGVIEKLVRAEGQKIKRFEAEKDLLNKEKSAWVALNNKIDDLQKAAAELHGFRSPFEDKIALSSDESILHATASRIAQPANSKIRVEQMALNERILTDPIDSARVLEKAALKISIGDEEVEVNFEGGRINDLADAINRQAGDYLTAKIAKNTEKTSVLILEADSTGEKNKILVDDNASVEFFKGIGLLEEKAGFEIDTELRPQKITPLKESMNYEVADKVLILEPENSVRMQLEKTVSADPDLVLKIKIRAVEIGKEEAAGEAAGWPALKNIGKVTVRDVDIIGGEAISKIKQPEETEIKEPVIDNRVIQLAKGDKITGTVNIDDLNEEFTEYTFNLTELLAPGEQLDRVLFINNNTDRRIEYTDFFIEDRTGRKGLVPKHQVQEAQDAVVYIDDVKVIRDSNEIEDSIKGVNLELRKESESDIDLTVDRDYEKITGKIIDMVSVYNDLLEMINNQTGVKSSGELDERNETGILTGDITVMGLKNKLQEIVMDPYPTDRGRDLAMLAQIGISMGAYGSSWDDIKEGFLKVDENKFIKAFGQYPAAIKQLFGSDNNNDVVIDNGVAFVLDSTLKGYTNTRNGIITNRIKNTDTGIKQQDKNIDNWNEHLDEYRARLERDFTVMQQALYDLEANQKSIENFTKQNQKQ